MYVLDSKVLYENLLQYMDNFKHQCPFCCHYFVTNNSLSGHIESIHEGKTFQCQYCEQKFTQKGYLKMHMQSIHEGKKH